MLLMHWWTMTNQAIMHTILLFQTMLTHHLSRQYDSCGRLLQEHRLTHSLFWPSILDLGAAAFKRHFRMRPESFYKLLHLLDLEPARRHPTGRGHPPIKNDKKLAMYLFRMASGNAVRIIGQLFQASDSSVVRATAEILSCIVDKLAYLIHFPTTKCEWLESAKRFEDIRKFPNVIGAIDCTHIEIKAPASQSVAYNSRKYKHTMQLQAVVDARGAFIDVFTGWPGSVSDARIWANSPLFQLLSNREIKLCSHYHLLGDGGYPLQPWLMVPYREDQKATAWHNRYNFAQSSTRTVVEHTFGQLKGRWRWLQKIDTRGHIKNIATIIISGCLLHNFCLETGDVFEKAWQMPEMSEEERLELFELNGHRELENREHEEQEEQDTDEYTISKAKRHLLMQRYRWIDPYTKDAD